MAWSGAGESGASVVDAAPRRAGEVDMPGAWRAALSEMLRLHFPARANKIGISLEFPL